MNDYGIIRQYGEKDLIGVPVRPITNFDHAKFEVIEPEWIEGSYYTSASGTATNSDMKYAIIDCTKYDYVLAGVSSEVSGNVFTGTRLAIDSGAMQQYVNMRSEGCSSFVLFDLTTYKYLLVSQSITKSVPVIGIILN